MTAKSLTPYENDSAYLDHEFAWVRAHVAVLDAEKKLNDSVRDEGDPTGHMIGKTRKVVAIDLALRLSELKAKEANIRSDIDARLEIHRQCGAFRLGLDRLCADAGLSADERRIVIFSTLPAISLPLATDVFAGLSFYSALQVGDIIQLLRAQGVTDWLKFRRLFLVGSPLVRKGILVEDFPTKINLPADLPSATINLTMRAFSTIVGEPDLVDEGLPPNDGAALSAD